MDFFGTPLDLLTGIRLPWHRLAERVRSAARALRHESRAPSEIEGLALEGTAGKSETLKAEQLKTEDHVAADHTDRTDGCRTFGYLRDPRNPR